MAAGIPGTLTRNEADWYLYFYDPEDWRDGASAHRYVAYERDGEVAGYVVYRQKENWEQAEARNEVRIGDLQASRWGGVPGALGLLPRHRPGSHHQGLRAPLAGPGHLAGRRRPGGCSRCAATTSGCVSSTWRPPWPPAAIPSPGNWCSK